MPLLVGLSYFISNTKQGKAMRAVAQDKDAAAMVGINVNRTISITFLIGGILAGASGVMYGLFNGITVFNVGFTQGLFAFTAAVLGGIGNLTRGRGRRDTHRDHRLDDRPVHRRRVDGDSDLQRPDTRAGVQADADSSATARRCRGEGSSLASCEEYWLPALLIVVAFVFPIVDTS